MGGSLEDKLPQNPTPIKIMLTTPTNTKTHFSRRAHGIRAHAHVGNAADSMGTLALFVVNSVKLHLTTFNYLYEKLQASMNTMQKTK